MSANPPALLDPPPARRESQPTPNGLWQRYHRDADEAVESELVRQYLPLVKSAAGRLAMTLPPHVELGDLHSAGLVGLLQALRNYDSESGTSFETYARSRIRGAMLDELRRMDWVPRSVHDKARRIEDKMAELGQRLGAPPTEVQMAQALNLPLDGYRRWLDEVRPSTFVCLDAVHPSEGGETANLHEFVEDESQANPTEEAARSELKQLIARRLQQLSEIQRKVLALYYVEDLHLREIAEVFGLTESRICQIHAQAILELRSFLRRVEAGAEDGTGMRRVS